MNSVWSDASLALLQSDPELNVGPALFAVFVWAGLIGVAVSVLIILGIFFSEVRRNKVW